MQSEPTFEPQEFLHLWREQRAYRVGRKIGSAGAVLSLIALFVDLHYSPRIIIYSDFALLAGCFFSLLWSHSTPKPYFCWWPLILGFWIATIASLALTGGIHSPFMGYYLATLFACTVVMQNVIRPVYFLIFVFSHIVVFLLLGLFFKLPQQETPDIFVAAVACVSLAALVVCIYEVLHTEQVLSGEFAERYRELRDARKELEREEASNLAKSTFLASVSHELRTPLAAILGYSELLQSSIHSASESDRASHCEIIRRNGNQLARLVDDLLDLSKIEAGKVEVFAQVVRLPEFLAEVLALVNLDALKKNLPVEIDFAGAVPEFLYTDPTRLKQVLLNLMGNAVKFTEQGYVRLTVDSAREAGRDVVNFSVRDTGRGISESERERLFKPFSQGDHAASRRYGGTGLGLSLSRKLARLLGGDLELVRSQPGAGSVFGLKLPVGQVERQNWLKEYCAPKTTAAESADFQEALSGLRVLVIDDGDDCLQLMQLLLESAGAQVDTALDGMAGIRMALTGDYHAVLMDIQMPLMDGYEATLTLRARGYMKPVLALTASARAEDRDRCLAVGCNDHLTKPISRAALIEAVAAAAGRPRTQNAPELPPELSV